MATVPINVPPGEVPQDLQAAIDALRAEGHTVQLLRDEDQERQHDPFAAFEEVDRIPEQLLSAMGMSREEIRRNRAAAPAVEHAHHPQTAAVHDSGAAGVGSTGTPAAG